MMLAIFIFMGAALAVAAFLILSSMRMSREEERELRHAREREDGARREAEHARATRAEWEAKLAADAAETIVVYRDPRGRGDGLGRDEHDAPARREGRFTRDVPAPFVVDQR